MNTVQTAIDVNAQALAKCATIEGAALAFLATTIEAIANEKCMDAVDKFMKYCEGDANKHAFCGALELSSRIACYGQSASLILQALAAAKVTWDAAPCLLEQNRLQQVVP